VRPAFPQPVESRFARSVHQRDAGDAAILDGDAVQFPHLSGAV